MRDMDFKAWLTGRGYDPGTINTQMARAKRLDQTYGDLDELFDRDKFAGLVASLTYSAEDKRKGAPNPSELEIKGDLYSNLASYRATLNFYQRFRDDLQTGRRPHTPKVGDGRFLTEVSRLMRVFKERMPDFETFAAEEGAFWETEGAYKRDARNGVLAALSDPTKGEEECGRDICKALGQSTRQGLPLSWRTLGEVARAPVEPQRSFFETVARLARLPAGDHQGLLQCARELESLRDAGIPGLRRGEVLGLAVSIYGTVNVNDACWFKARTFDRLGKALLGHKLFPSPRFEIADFEEFQWVMNRIRDQLDDWNWQTGSLTDVQGFIWVAMAEEWGEAGAADLTRKAVEMAMDECDKIGTDAFLTKYQFGKPRDYWVRREGDRTLYPAKATVGAAYGFMPGGKPQGAKEFHGGFGEQAANSILQRLGFEIVSGRPNSMAEPGNSGSAFLPPPINLILFGPPGTGKTYATAEEAVRLCGEAVPDDREDLMALYRSLHQKGRIALVTFHQNFSYEDFVEGLRPVTVAQEEGTGASAGFSLQPQDGIFKLIADLAASNRGRAAAGGVPAIDRKRKIFKMSLGRSWASEDDAIYQEAIRGGYVVLGWGGEVDWSDVRYDAWEAIKERWRQDHPDATGNDPNMSQMFTFRINMQIGSLVVISDGNRKFRAVGEITGPYQFVPGPNGEYNHRRAVRWLWHSDESLPRELIYEKELSQVSAYQMNSRHVNWEALEQIVAGGEATGTGTPESFVLIIDEINRANISKVFGELITLLEPDKRLGMPNALTVRLPYSKQEFGVPANLHVVGTMNTADRSIALLDTALRRRFVFRELAPEPSLLREDVDGVPLRRVLQTINDRIEYLIDREHRVGHAFFLGRGGEDRSAIDATMRDKVIPLLQEYFFEDWSRVAAVLGEPPGKGGGFLDCRKLRDPTGRNGEERESWSVRPTFAPDAYDRLVGKPAPSAPAEPVEGPLEEAAE